jgi:hypothetical protein
MAPDQPETRNAPERSNTAPDNKKQAFHYELMGLVYFQAGRLQESETAFPKAIEEDPDPSLDPAHQRGASQRRHQEGCDRTALRPVVPRSSQKSVPSMITAPSTSAPPT